MRKALYCGIVAALLVTFALRTHAKSDGTSFFPLEQVDSPMAMIETTHSSEDGLKAAIIKNVANQPVVEYRIGWVAVQPQGARTSLGLRVSLPEGVMPGRTVNVPPQLVPMNFYKEGAIGVGFFVSEIRFADGQIWKADLDAIEAATSKQCAGLWKNAK
jgi:hypothetical protein